MKRVNSTVFLLLIFFGSISYGHRDSNIDNLRECEWNKKFAEGEAYTVECNDLYHLYSPSKKVKAKKAKSFELGAFNTFKLGSGDARFKDYGLTANIIKNYDLIAVSEVQPSTSEEFDSNMNLAKTSSLNFKKYYHRPGYLKLLEKLRESNSSWALILSPAGQSDTEELLGFYFRTDRVQLENSTYCKVYNKKLRSKDRIFFAGGFGGPRFERKAKTPHLNKSYGCLLDLSADQNDIFRLPFSARFKVRSGFDLQYLSYHARFSAPIVVGGGCGFECLERVNSFLNTKFHIEGAFLKTLDHRGLKFLENHIDYLRLKKGPDLALFEKNGPVIKYKISKPRVYENLISIKSLMLSSFSKHADKVWRDSFSKKIKKTDKDKIKSFIVGLFENSDSYNEYKKFIGMKGRDHLDFIESVLSTGLYAQILKRRKIWTAPEKTARFYEVSLILEEMERISKIEKDNDVVLGGDLNLEDSEDTYFWNFFNNHFDYSTVAIGSPTSISKKNGLSKAYDHFMYDGKSSLDECKPVEASVLDFVNEETHWKGFEKYFVKSKTQIKTLSKAVKARLSKLRFINSKGEPVSADKINVRKGFTSCWDGVTRRDQPLSDVWKTKFECRTLNQFLNGPDSFRLYTDLISDHLPVGMKCSKTSDLD